jgi:hypothetical protein
MGGGRSPNKLSPNTLIRDTFKRANSTQFYFKNKPSVPTLVGNVKSLREIMLNVKMGGQNKAVPITKGLVVNDQVISSEDGVEITLRIYTPFPPSEGLPIMI